MLVGASGGGGGGQRNADGGGAGAGAGGGRGGSRREDGRPDWPLTGVGPVGGSTRHTHH